MIHLKPLALAIALTISSIASLNAQNKTEENKPVYQFSDKVIVKHTPIKNQSSSGTCWCFAGMGLIEAEILRMYDIELDLSEMYSVRWAYTNKVNKYIRMHGNNTLSPGGEVCDALYAVNAWGMVPETEYRGLNYGEDRHVHGELHEVINSYAKAIIKNSNRKISTAWENGLQGILDAYLGEMPEKFNYNGKEYTPTTFAAKYPVKSENYVQISAFTHRPYYQTFQMEIPDNWTWSSTYNMPMNDLMRVLDYALENGYTVGWAQDVSDKGFSRNGVGIVPEDNIEVLKNTNPERYKNMSDKEIKESLYAFTEIVPEKEVTEEMHQEAYNNWQTTDDHSMLIVGYAYDQNGKKYYKIKNSWGTDNMTYNGYWYCSEAYMKLRTIFFTLNKEAFPKDIKKKLSL